MKALISTIEPREGGWRVAQVEPDDNTFPVADAFFWTDCPDDCVADLWYYDIQEQICKPIPQPEN